MNEIKKALLSNPEVTKELQEFFTDKLLKTIEQNENLPPSFAEVLKTKGVSVALLENYLTSTPRLMCDFMDEKGIIILIKFEQDKFTYTINGKAPEEDYMCRKEAETSAAISSISFYKESVNKNDD